MSLPSSDPDRLLQQLAEAATSNGSVDRFARAILADAWRGTFLGDSCTPMDWLLRIGTLGASVGNHPMIAELIKTLHIASDAVGDGRIDSDLIATARRLAPLLAAIGQTQAGITASGLHVHFAGEELESDLEELVETGLVLVSSLKNKPRYYALSARGKRAMREVKE